MPDYPNQGTLYRERMRFERDFTQIPNAWARDRRLSFAARGILEYLMTHEAGFQVSMAGLQSETWKEGREAIRSAVTELEKYGYLHRVKHRTRGRFVGFQWVLQDPFDLPGEYVPQLPLEGLEPVDNSHHRRRPTVDGFPSDGATERRLTVDGEPHTIEDQIKNTSRPSATTGARRAQPVDIRLASCGHRLVDDRHCEIGCRLEATS